MKRMSVRHPISRPVSGLTIAFALLTGPATVLRAQAPPAEPPIVDNDTSPYHVALLDYKAGHFQEALDALGNANGGQDLRIVILKSHILSELGRYDEGEKLLASLLTPTGPYEVQLALADLLLRKRDFNDAAKFYDLALNTKPGDPDLLLMMVYTRVGAGDLVTAAKIASQLKPLDPEHPSYYFAKAAIAQSTDKTGEAEDDIETARTMYGITVANRYLKTYLEVLSAPGKSALMTPASTNAASTNAPPASPK
jgi:tetratricopeptide (TPR) repeat protein